MIAYVSAEIGLRSDVPTYSGGLGVLAGDHLKAAADAGVDIVGVSLLYRQGYFEQHLDANGVQSEAYPGFDPSAALEDTGVDITLPLDGTTLHARVWTARITGVTGHGVDILFLDSMHPRNAADHVGVAARLYGGDDAIRLRRQYLLGVGGVRALKALGRWPLRGLHLNEGHCAFAALAMLEEGWSRDDLRRRSLFTTHTPVPAGHHRYEWPQAESVLGAWLPSDARELAGQESLSMSHLAASLAGRVNAVSVINAEVSSDIFPGARIEPVTNGVHHNTWTSPAMAALYDRHMPGWREDPSRLTDADRIPDDDLQRARSEARRVLRDRTRSATGIELDPDILTIGFARRFAPYKRADLVFHDLDRLVSICGNDVQFVFAGKAHPRDARGKALIEAVFSAAKALRGQIVVAFLPNYSMDSGLAITSGADVWLNNPVRPLEASGTSGMKASMNGVPNCSIPDGWWPEACEHGVNGWMFGGDDGEQNDADALYTVLEREVLPRWRAGGPRWSAMMRAAITTSARFTAARMLAEYERIYASFDDPANG